MYIKNRNKNDQDKREAKKRKSRQHVFPLVLLMFLSTKVVIE
jgi:hypothetical protein